ncbi:MAG: hypothetical protein M1829_002090 [Trizodia sp. TS-e1964]|nr:MAG: hypothetical protein M1829_002090 [Trizodia sp. TS-e1964]
MSLWRSFQSLQPKTRALIGLGVMGYGVVGLLATDQAEKVFGMAPSEEDRQRLNSMLPKILVVEREE